MSVIQLLALLLAVSVAVHIGYTAAFIACRGGAEPPIALLVGAGSARTACTLYLTAVSAYH